MRLSYVPYSPKTGGGSSSKVNANAHLKEMSHNQCDIIQITLRNSMTMTPPTKAGKKWTVCQKNIT